MTRENLLFAIIGILFGFIVGFMFASSMSQKTALSAVNAGTGSSQSMPSDHPPVGAQNAGADPAAIREQVTSSIAKAKNEPQNFDAQMQAAELYYQIQRYDQAIEYLLKANKIKPNDTIVLSGLAAVTIEKGDAKAAEDAIAKLEKADPTNVDLPQFKEKLEALKKK
jgi:tetratricopeptide (TPR) repeat protein